MSKISGFTECAYIISVAVGREFMKRWAESSDVGSLLRP